ncbi:porwaprin-b-like [Erythrolamprus reginae]|uniref:porwaprin-b-like n=1 Tax=Erythrolamprus reginae TaxID=121349 RepID=UPI00396CCB13
MKAAHGLLLLLLGLLIVLGELAPSGGETETLKRLQRRATKTMTELEAKTIDEDFQKLVKPGLCPRAPPGAMTSCVKKCESDDECPGKQKCCHVACSIECMEPCPGPGLLDCFYA